MFARKFADKIISGINALLVVLHGNIRGYAHCIVYACVNTLLLLNVAFLVALTTGLAYYLHLFSLYPAALYCLQSEISYLYAM